MAQIDVTGSKQPQRAPIGALLAAQAISYAGNSLSRVAIPWFVLQTTGSPWRTGLAAAATFLPVVLSGVFGGALVDRLGYKRTSVLADLSSAVPIAMIPLLHLTVGLAYWQLLALVFLSALFDAPGETSRMSLVPEFARLARIRLERVNSAVGGIRRAPASPVRRSPGC